MKWKTWFQFQEMRHSGVRPAIFVVLVSLALTSGNPAWARGAEIGSNAPGPVAAPSFSSSPEKNTGWTCLPSYRFEEYLLTINHSSPLEYEPNPDTLDLNGDGLDDILITKLTFQTYTTYAVDVLLNDGHGGLTLATESIFQGDPPRVQHPRQVVVADFNGDGVEDAFVADHGYDADPFPGYPNTLILSRPGGQVIDASANLPQQSDFTHSACAADVDGDHDVDLYIGNLWGGSGYDPAIWLNNGSGQFTAAANRLPELTSLHQNGYTTCTLADIDSDGDSDLLLGDAGDDISNPYSTRTSEVLLNDGDGVFSRLPGAMPLSGHAESDTALDIAPLLLDGDAHLDLLVLWTTWDYGRMFIQVLVNNGDGTFRDDTTARLTGFPPSIALRWLKLRDMDHDGDLDLLALSWNPDRPDPLLFFNDGHGHLLREPKSFMQKYLYYSFLDLDGDGGHDTVYLTYAPPEQVYAIRDLGCPVFLPFVIKDYWP